MFKTVSDKKNSVRQLTCAAVIAALYVVLTAVSGALGIAYGGIQLRLSEALTVLPLFFPAAIPGLTLGCAIANLGSTLGPADVLFGTLATFTAALLTAALRGVKIKGFPFLSLLMPVFINALVIAAELTLITAAEKTAAVYFIFFGEVFAGQAISVFAPGTAVIKLTRRVIKAGGLQPLCFRNI